MTHLPRWVCRMRSVQVGVLVFRDPILLCGVLYLLLYFDASGFLRLGLLAAVLHELGHIAVYALLRRRLPVIEVTLTGFCMKTRGERFSPGQLFALAAAGPGVNFLLALLWTLRMAQRLTIRGGAFWAANLLTGCFNLLPIPPLDGSKIVAYFLPPRAAWAYMSAGRYGFIILVLLLATGLLGHILGPLIGGGSDLLLSLVGIK